MAFNSIRSIFSRAKPELNPDEISTLVGPRIPRHSSGWSAMLKHLKSEEALRVLDIGPTSSSNVNFLTALGHSIYMADIVSEANQEEWVTPPGDESDPLDLDAFFEKNMPSTGRNFDVVLLWTTLDYLPEHFLEPIIARLHANLQPNGRILAFFHTKTIGPETDFYRYHVTDKDAVEMQLAERFAVRRVYTNRKIEQLFSAFENCKFFLAKDNVYEVLVTR